MFTRGNKIAWWQRGLWRGICGGKPLFWVRSTKLDFTFTLLNAVDKQSATMDGTSLMLLLPAGHCHHIVPIVTIVTIVTIVPIIPIVTISIFDNIFFRALGFGVGIARTGSAYGPVSKKFISSSRSFSRQPQGAPLGWLTWLVMAQKLRWVNVFTGFLTMIQMRMTIFWFLLQ